MAACHVLRSRDMYSVKARVTCNVWALETMTAKGEFMNATPGEMTGDDLERELRSVDPAAAAAIGQDAVHQLLRQAKSSAAQARSGRGHGRSRRFWAVVALAAVGVGVPTAAVGSGMLAQTGWFGSPATSTEEDTSEYIDTGAADYLDYAAAQWPSEVVLPDGYDTQAFAEAAASYLRPSGGVMVQRTSILFNFEDAARYAWMREWLDANAVGDTAREQRAAEVLTDPMQWQAAASSDGGGVIDHIRAVGQAALDGDRAVVEEDAQRYSGFDEGILDRARA